MPIKSVKMKISKNKKMRFFLMSQGSLNPKIRFLGQKACPVARGHTDTHESDYPASISEWANIGPICFVYRGYPRICKVTLITARRMVKY